MAETKADVTPIACEAEQAANGRHLLSFQGRPFSVLPNVYFALACTPETTAEEARDLARRITARCPAMLARYIDQPTDGLPTPPLDEDGSPTYWLGDDLQFLDPEDSDHSEDDPEDIEPNELDIDVALSMASNRIDTTRAVDQVRQNAARRVVEAAHVQIVKPSLEPGLSIALTGALTFAVAHGRLPSASELTALTRDLWPERDSESDPSRA